MTYRAALIDPASNEILHEHGNLLTDAQWAKFAHWSWQQQKSVHELITEMRPMIEQVGDSERVNITGKLPHCGLFGCIDPDGRCHT